MTAVSDARAVLGAKEVAGLQIGSSVSDIGGVSLIEEILAKDRSVQVWP